MYRESQEQPRIGRKRKEATSLPPNPSPMLRATVLVALLACAAAFSPASLPLFKKASLPAVSSECLCCSRFCEHRNDSSSVRLQGRCRSVMPPAPGWAITSSTRRSPTTSRILLARPRCSASTRCVHARVVFTAKVFQPFSQCTCSHSSSLAFIHVHDSVWIPMRTLV